MSDEQVRKEIEIWIFDKNDKRTLMELYRDLKCKYPEYFEKLKTDKKLEEITKNMLARLILIDCGVPREII